MNSLSLKGKTVLVTGASSGIGRACALAFAHCGCNVVGVSRHCPEGTKKFEGGGSLTLRRMDVTKKASIQQVIKDLPKIDIAILAAGMGVAGSIEDTPLEYAKQQMEVNYFGVIRSCQAILPVMRAAGEGRIIVIGSVAGRISIPMQSHYSSSKYALEALVDALRMEIRPFGLSACIIEPGDTKTGFTDSRKTYYKEGSPYNEAIEKAVGQMEGDEQNGASPYQIARLALRMAVAKNPPSKVTAGMKYKTLVQLVRFLPDRVRESVVRSIYC